MRNLIVPLFYQISNLPASLGIIVMVESCFCQYSTGGGPSTEEVLESAVICFHFFSRPELPSTLIATYGSSTASLYEINEPAACGQPKYLSTGARGDFCIIAFRCGKRPSRQSRSGLTKTAGHRSGCDTTILRFALLCVHFGCRSISN